MRLVFSLVILVIALPLLSTQSFAADKYQLMPIYSGSAGFQDTYSALVVTLDTGEISSCSVTYNWSLSPGPGQELFSAHQCNKVTVAVGTMPPGPVFLPPLGPSGTPEHFSQHPGLWKIDQSTGKVTFCASPGFGVTDWACIVLN